MQFAHASFSARVLVAEDSAINRRLIEELLRLSGCHVELVSNGYEAVEAFQRGAFDLVLMDCRMPGLDGFGATRSIRRHEAETATRVPIVALTAYDDPENAAQCTRSGMDDYLLKPFSLESLQETLNRWLTLDRRLGQGDPLEMLADAAD